VLKIAKFRKIVCLTFIYYCRQPIAHLNFLNIEKIVRLITPLVSQTKEFGIFCDYETFHSSDTVLIFEKELLTRRNTKATTRHLGLQKCG